MTRNSPIHAPATQRTFAAGYVFGVPLGNLGWFATLLMAAASGFMAFFASTFCAIVFILIYNSATHRTLDFALSYRRVGLPIGLVVMAIALGTLGTLWLRRILRRN
jgi:TRAP-type C4-dicarboxylate transport system permease small subunit